MEHAKFSEKEQIALKTLGFKIAENTETADAGGVGINAIRSGSDQHQLTIGLSNGRELLVRIPVNNLIEQASKKRWFYSYCTRCNRDGEFLVDYEVGENCTCGNPYTYRLATEQEIQSFPHFSSLLQPPGADPNDLVCVFMQFFLDFYRHHEEKLREEMQRGADEFKRRLPEIFKAAHSKRARDEALAESGRST
jgi:hypothetical protein